MPSAAAAEPSADAPTATASPTSGMIRQANALYPFAIVLPALRPFICHMQALPSKRGGIMKIAHRQNRTQYGCVKLACYGHLKSLTRVSP